jgi:hypothetical protein
MPNIMTAALLFAGPLLFGTGAAIIMLLLLDIAILGDHEREPGKNLRRALAILGWFLGNSASVVGTLFYVDLAAGLGNPSADSIALLSYLSGFGGVMTILGVRSLYSSSRARLDRLCPDLTTVESHSVLLVLHYGIAEEHAARVLGISREQLKINYASALRKMARLAKKNGRPGVDANVS